MAVKVLFILVTIIVLVNICESQYRKELYAPVPQLIQDAGYPSEKYRAKTEDGYILQIHRIPAGRRSARKSGPSVKGKRAVLICHGLLGSSGDFVIMGPNRSLAYYLADAGYDVWLANLRGNWYTAHQNLTRDRAKFWDYSFHEHGKYDLPATIDKILKVTGLQKLLYIGYSMGTTSFFTMAALRPEYNDKVVAYIALAPAVYLDNIKELATIILKQIDLPGTFKARGMKSATVPRQMIDMLSTSVCTARRAADDICMRFAYYIVGEDYEQNDWDMTPVIMARVQPASWRQLEHFGKIAITGVFTSWEDGLWGKVVPYNLTNVRVPVTLLYGENDQLTDKTQIMKLAQELSTNGVLEEVKPGCSWPKFNHIDFIFAKDVGVLLNRKVVDLVDNLYNKYGPS